MITPIIINDFVIYLSEGTFVIKGVSHTQMGKGKFRFQRSKTRSFVFFVGCPNWAQKTEDELNYKIVLSHAWTIMGHAHHYHLMLGKGDRLS